MTDTMVPNGGYAVANGVATSSASGAAQALASGGSIDDTSMAYANVTSANLNPVTDVLTLYDGGGSATMQLSGNLQGASIGLSSDGGGGVDIVDMGASTQVDDPVPTASTPRQTVILAGGNLQFVNTYAGSVGQGYENAIVTAEAFYQSTIANAATLDFTFDMAPGVGAGTNSYSTVNASFSQLKTALANTATSANDQAAVAAIGALGSEFAGSTFEIAEPLALALGLPGATAGTTDTTQLDSTLSYFYNQSDPVAGSLDAVSILEHEISEGGLGRVGGDGSSNGVMDLFRYAASGVPDATLGRDGSPAYFSIDGTQLLTEFHNPISPNGRNDGADSADWDASGTGQEATPIAGQANEYDSYGAATDGAVGVVTYTDLQVLDVMGWTLSSTPPITTVSSGQTVTVAAGQVDSGVTVQSGGELDVGSGGTAQATVISGGIEFVMSGALDTGGVLEAGGEQVVSSGASASGVTVSSGGFQLVRSGGFSSATAVLSGGLERFYSGASAANLVVGSGATLGTELLVPGGTSAALTTTVATTTTVVSGVTVLSGGVIETQAATIDSGGFLALAADTTLPGLTTVSSGGTLSGPGNLTGDVLDYGVVDGGVINGSSTADRGIVYLEAGGSIAGATLAGDGELVVSTGASVDGLTLREGAVLDLAGVSATSASIDASGELVATSGGVTLEALPGVSAPGLTFSVASDGNGGVTLKALAAASDYNGDGLSDLTWRNTDGDAGVWMTTSAGGSTVVDFGGVDPAWVIQAVGDFNGDGKADLLWRNTSTGQVGEWLSNTGSGYAGFTAPIIAVIDPSWQIDGVGDFNGDGVSDILWRNTDGDTALWFTNAGGGYTPLDLGVIDPSWQVQGVGDFNGDGKADILWRNNTTGQMGEWLSNSGTGYAAFTAPILATVDLSWKIQGVGDFTGGGLSDILWRNTNGDTGVWLTTAGGGFSVVDFGVIALNWTIQGVGDFNGDGKADILWRNTATGQVGEWLSKAGTGYAGFTAPILTTIDPSWQLQGVPPALQGNLVSSAAPLAQAMASMDAPGGSTANATASVASTSNPLIAAPALGPHGLAVAP